MKKTPEQIRHDEILNDLAAQEAAVERGEFDVNEEKKTRYETLSPAAKRVVDSAELNGTQTAEEAGLVFGTDAFREEEASATIDTAQMILDDPGAYDIVGLTKADRVAVYDYVDERFGWVARYDDDFVLQPKK